MKFLYQAFFQDMNLTATQAGNGPLEAPAQLTWTGDGVVSDPHNALTEFSFAIPANVEDGDILEVVLQAEATDNDGIRAIGTLDIVVNVTNTLPATVVPRVPPRPPRRID